MNSVRNKECSCYSTVCIEKDLEESGYCSCDWVSERMNVASVGIRQPCAPYTLNA